MTRADRRYTRKFSVTIGSKSTIVCAETSPDAIERAVVKLYGRRCFWFPDSGVPGYGQVFEALRPSKNNSHPGNSSVTSRVSIDVAHVGLPSRNFVQQQQEDARREKEERAIMASIYEEETAAYDAGYQGRPMPAGNTNSWAYADGQRGAFDHSEYEEEMAIDEPSQEEQPRQQYMALREQEAREEHEERRKHASRVAAEVDRLRAIPPDMPITDQILAAIIRNTIAPATFPHGIPLGEWKRSILNGERPELVREYLSSDKIYLRLENVVR